MILLDTDILIDLLRSRPETLSWFEKEFSKKDSLHISLVTKLELLRGCKRKKERVVLYDWLKSFHLVHLSEVISEKAEELFEKYYPKQGLGILDALIAATTICSKLVLYSGNQKHFKGISGLTLKKSY